jgi:hypothetical protein
VRGRLGEGSVERRVAGQDGLDSRVAVRALERGVHVIGMVEGLILGVGEADGRGQRVAVR